MSGRARRTSSGAYLHTDHRANHVIYPGDEEVLERFLGQQYGGLQHKRRNAHSSNSEDALTWSCFRCLANVQNEVRHAALAQLWDLAYDGKRALPSGVRDGRIEVGRTFGDIEKTEVDASIEGPGALVFIEAKLYEGISQAKPPGKPHNQIQRKLRVGAREAAGRDFYFIILDIAPPEKLRELYPRGQRISLDAASTSQSEGFRSKWLTAWWYSRYRNGRRGSTKPLRQLLEEPPSIPGADAAQIARNIGWLTWADVFKVVLRAALEAHAR